MGITFTIEMAKSGLPRMRQPEHHGGDPGSQEQGEVLFPCAQKGAGFFSHPPTAPIYTEIISPCNTKRTVIKAFQGSGGTKLVPGTVL